MKAKQILAIFIAMLLVAMVVGIAGVALADATTTWLLDSEAVTDGKEMERDGGLGDNGQTGSVTISASGSQLWISDETAQNDLGFSTANWYVNLYRSGVTTSSHDLTVDIGVWDGSFTSKGNSGTQTFTAGVSYLSFNYSVDAFSVSTGEYIVFQIANLDESTSLTIVTTGGSDVTYPPDEPAYPVPELPTIILLATGLVCVAGYFGFKRRKQGYIKAQ